MKSWDDKLFCLGVLTIVANLALFVWQNIAIYTSRFDVAKYETVYEHSQYNVPKNEFWGNIDDPELYSLAGVKYLQGADPAAINFEHQPLAKYFFGLSILFSGNAAVVQFCFGVMLLALTYFASRKVFPGRSLAIAPAAILSFDFLFKEQIAHVYLDLFLTVNILILSLLLIGSLTARKLLPLAIFWVGVVALSKSVLVGPVVLFTTFIFLGLEKREYLFQAGKYTLLAALAYLAGYIFFFRYHSFLDFVRLHLQEIRLYRSYVPRYPKGETFRIIFFAKWRKWFDDFGLMTVPTWSILWPVGLLSLISSVFLLLKKLNYMVLFHLLWAASWLFVISLRLVFPRHLLPVLPSFYILLVFSLYNIGKRIKYGYWD